MTKKFEANFQFGKQGLTQPFIDSLNNALKNHRQLRISVLKSGTRDKDELRKLAMEIRSKLDKNTIIKIIGFTMIFRVVPKGVKQTSKV